MIKKSVSIWLIAAFCIFSFASTESHAAGSKPKLNMKYPVILVHGWAGSDSFFNSIDYFWGIKSALEDEGAEVYVAKMDSFNWSEVRARQLRTQIMQILASTGSQKVNIIAHSQGGVTSRYMISNMNMHKHVASLVMISTPNRGTSLTDLVLGIIPDAPRWILSSLADTLWGGIAAGSDDSDFEASLIDCSRKYMNTYFNPNTPDKPGVVYMSYAARSYGWSLNPVNNLLIPSWHILRHYEGRNDGVVSVSSSRWGEYKGEVRGLFGVDHWMSINQVFGLTPGFNAAGFYVGIAENLQKRGL